MFIAGAIIGFILGMLTILARDFRDLKNIFKKEYREIRNKIYTPKNEGNVLSITPEGVEKIERDEREKAWYGDDSTTSTFK
jgi:hypothetical protein